MLFATGALRAVLITRQIHAGVASTCTCTGRLAEAARPPRPPSTHAVAVVWPRLHVHKCIRNGVSVLCVLSDCVLKAVIHDCFPCLLAAFLRSCEAERACQPRGDWKLPRCLTSASGPGVHRSSHLHTDVLINTHRHIDTRYTHGSLFWGGSITICLPDKCCGLLAWRILPQPIRPPLTFSSHPRWKELHSSSFLSAICAAEFLLLSYEMQQQLMYKLNQTKG